MKQGWEIKKLGEVAEYFNGLTYSPKDVSDNGTIVLRSSNVQNDELDFSDIVRVNVDIKDKLFLKEGDILMCSRNGSQRLVGKTAPILNLPEPLTFGTFMMIIRSEFSPYLLWFFKTDEFKKQISGGENTMINQVTRYMLDEIKISLPPLPEQQRIVSILDDAFAAIAKAKANAEQNLLNSNELFENAAQEIFTQKGINWEEKLLGEFATFRNGINYTKGSKGKKIKIVGVKDFKDSYWVPDNDLVEVSLDGKINETDLLQEGDILAVRSNGNPQLIGRTLLAGKINEKVSHSGFTIRIRLNSKIVNPNYLCHFLKIQQTRKTLVESGNGVGIRSLNQGSLSSLKIPFPKSLREQEAIIDKVDSIAKQSQKLKDIYQKKIDDLEELKKSILAKAFAGELMSEPLINAD